MFCSGKIYYDLAERREKEGADDTAIIRLEQLYPFPKKQLNALLKKYNRAESFTWVQEEPENAGAWRFVKHWWNDVQLNYIGRHEAASPATGYAKRHQHETEEILSKVFAKEKVN